MSAPPHPGRALPVRGLGTRLATLLPFACLLALFALQLWLHATRTSATSDEPVHILGGYRYWECGEFVVNPQHPPLLKLLAALPLRGRPLIEPDWRCGTRNPPWQEIEYAATRFVAQNGTDPVLIPARLAAAAMSLLLALLICLFASEMFGRTEALVALALLAFEPTLIAHGSLVTTDMALAATTVGAVYAVYRYGKRRSVPRLLTAGAAAGLILASKHSGILILPIVFVLLLADRLLLRRRTPAGGTSIGGDILRSAAAYLVIVLVAVGMVWAAYGFRYYAQPGATHEVLPFAAVFTPRSTDAVRSVSATLAAVVHRARVFPESYIFGLAYRIPTSVLPMYLLGKVYPTGRWFYFPVAFTIKSSIALLILLPLSLCTPALYRTHPREMLFLLLPSLGYFAMSMASDFNIGVRHLLPAYALFIVSAAAGACWWSRRHRAALSVLVALLVFHAVAAARTAPSYIAFANDLWGGTRNTYRFLNDSNVEWGQNLKLVEAYLAGKDIHDCWFAAYGVAELVRPYKTCRKLPSFGWASTEHLVDLVPPVIDGTILISTWELPPWGGRQYAPLLETPPVDVIGGSILVFHGHFAVPLAAALSYTSRADQLLGWQRNAEALQDARQAVALGPNDPRTHWELAVVAARNGLADEARREAEAAKRLAPQGPAYFRSVVGG